jgi:ribulose-5-phosphate 4-epimerase/fuculose-1-phosphate aldolase
MIMACLQYINHENVQMSNHGMFAAHKLLKHEYGMIMACLQHINHENVQMSNHGMFVVSTPAEDHY